ncbi:MAG: hypothetical protein Q9187_009402, partial [Circinaria calcarea]
MTEACTALGDVAAYVTWDEDPDIWPRIEGTKRQGLTHVTSRRRGEEIQEDSAEAFKVAADHDLAANYTHRQLFVTIASQYVDAILIARQNGDHDQNLIATFSAAMNIIREIGHVIFLQDLRQPFEHYWVNQNLESEPGNSFIAWFFNGWYPQDSYIDNEAEHLALRCGMHWCKQHAADEKTNWMAPRHPSGLIYYSIPLEHMSRMLSDDAWSRFRDLQGQSEEVRRTLLYPKTPFRIGRHARCGKQIRMDLWDLRTENTGQKYRSYIKQTAEDYVPYFDEDWDDTPIGESPTPPGSSTENRKRPAPDKRKRPAPDERKRPTPDERKRPAPDEDDDSSDSDNDNSGHEPKHPRKKRRLETQTYTEPLGEDEQAAQAEHDWLFEQQLLSLTTNEGNSISRRIPRQRDKIARRVNIGLDYIDKTILEMHQGAMEIRENGSSDQQKLDAVADLAREAGMKFPQVERAARRPIKAAR